MLNKRPNALMLDNTKPNWIKKQFNKGIIYTHGSNSESFKGLTKFRTLLSMEEIDGTPWFHRYGGLKSGERGYTKVSCYTGQPISQGVSINTIFNYNDSIRYAQYGCDHSLVYPVLYGLIEGFEVLHLSGEHPVSHRGISLDFIAAIWVPKKFTVHARHKLSTLRSYRLSNCVQEDTIGLFL
jgi:hypothetical protein